MNHWIGQMAPDEGLEPTTLKTPKHQKILLTLLEYLLSPAVMAYPNFELPFTLHCDASEDGLGAVLYQKFDEKMKVIAYASRSLSPAEKNYHIHSGKLEFLAMKRAICDKYRPYCYIATSSPYIRIIIHYPMC